MFGFKMRLKTRRFGVSYAFRNHTILVAPYCTISANRIAFNDQERDENEKKFHRKKCCRSKFFINCVKKMSLLVASYVLSQTPQAEVAFNSLSNQKLFNQRGEGITDPMPRGGAVSQLGRITFIAILLKVGLTIFLLIRATEEKERLEEEGKDSKAKKEFRLHILFVIILSSVVLLYLFLHSTWVNMGGKFFMKSLPFYFVELSSILGFAYIQTLS